MFKKLIILLLFIMINKSIAQETIVLFRHGEKPNDGLGQINCQGLNRALKLPQVLYTRFGNPDYLFAPAPSIYYKKNKYHYVRGLVAIAPTSIQMKKSINTPFKASEHQKMATTLLEANYHKALIFIAWEHNNLYEITRDIFELLDAPANTIPTWSSDDFDSLFIIRIDWEGKKPQVTLTHLFQNLNHLSHDCPNASDLQMRFETTTQMEEKIILVPAAEPAEDGLGQLNCYGLNRALALQTYLHQHYLHIDRYIVPHPKKGFITEQGGNYYYLRALMTIEPTAVMYNMPLHTKFGYKDINKLAEYILQERFQKKTLLISNESKQLIKLIKKIYQLRGERAPILSNQTNHYDLIYTLTFNAKNHPQLSLETMSENLSLSPICPEAIH